MPDTVLIVDDAAYMRVVIRRALEAAGFGCLEAADGEQAIAMFAAYQPELVLMDLVMPDMDGIAAVKALKRWDPKATIVMCSAIGQDSRIEEAKAAGAVSFVLKPFHASKVVRALRLAALTRPRT